MKFGLPVVNFSVTARSVCFPLYEIHSTLYSFPSTNSSMIAVFSKLTSLADAIAAMIPDFELSFVTALLPDLSVGLTIIGYSSPSSSTFTESSAKTYLGQGTFFSVRAFLIANLLVDLYVHEIELPESSILSAT